MNDTPPGERRFIGLARRQVEPPPPRACRSTTRTQRTILKEGRVSGEAASVAPCSVPLLYAGAAETTPRHAASCSVFIVHLTVTCRHSQSLHHGSVRARLESLTNVFRSLFRRPVMVSSLPVSGGLSVCVYVRLLPEYL